MGNDNFAKPLRDLGHQVWRAGAEPAAELHLSLGDPDWREVCAQAAAKRLVFDMVLVGDDVGCRTLPTGLWGAEAVTVFYGVDSPLNRFWQTPYARLFDLPLLDQPREAADLARLHPSAGWLPVGVDLELYAGQGPENRLPGVCFVGVLDPPIRPKRSAVLDKVAQVASLETQGGRRQAWFPTQEAARLYRSWQVVLNENLFPGVTTRPLEVMASGGCLLSEAAPGAMDLFFKDQEHLLFFEPQTLLPRLRWLLEDEALRRRLAEAGRQEVWERHGLERRAQVMCCLVEELRRKPPQERGRAQGRQALCQEGEALLWAALRWPGPMSLTRLSRAAGRLRVAAQEGIAGACRSLGLALSVLGGDEEGLAHLDQAAQNGDPLDLLALGLASHQAGRGGGPQWRRLSLAGGPGQAGFHLEAARLLASSGQDMCPGFSRLGLPMVCWTALEHLLEATRQQPALAPAWELLADLLLARGQPNQAHDCYLRAQEAGGGPGLEDKLARAALEGYLL